MENIEATGVNEPVAAEQEVTAVNETTAEATSTETPTGVEEEISSPAAEDEPKFDEKTESAFAKRLAAERAKIEAEATKKASEIEQALQARDAEVARRFGDKGITTWDQLVSGWDMAQKQQQQQIVDQTYMQTIKKIADSYGADPDLLSQIVNEAVRFHPLAAKANQLEQQFGELQTEKQMKEKMDRDIADFRSVYPEVDAKTIPDVVWEKVNSGMALVDAYRVHENTVIKEELAELKKALQVQKTNEANSATSPGSVKGDGGTADDFITFDTFEKNKANQSWVI
ncbi:MAG TPA: hypothetical protein P5280_07560, partial [Cyclobacteriaceae bacterium]|nr:hypothetical protein [Cyclobacteriaceae bacterium]